jgi:flavodoxin
MNRLFVALLAALLICTLTACGVQAPGTQETSSGSQAAPVSNASSMESNSSVDVSQPEVPSNAQEDIPPSEPPVSDADGKTLIAYFSLWGNVDYPDGVDATTSASIVISNSRFGTTEYVARMIQEETGGYLHLIETVKPYPADFQAVIDQNHEETANGVLPELKGSRLDLSGYDTVFLGYPVWATDVPQAIHSFLEQNDLSGKTVIPFCTHDGYGAGRSYSTVREVSGANTLSGLAIEAKDVPNAKGTVTAWLESIGVSGGQSSPAETGETPIKITVGDVTLDGVLYDTALAREIREQFPLTISMSGFGGREYYGGVDFYPTNLEGGQRNFENGHITYCEAHHNMAIFYAQTDNPTLSVDVIPIGKVSSDLGVFDTLGSREEITFSLAE